MKFLGNSKSDCFVREGKLGDKGDSKAGQGSDLTYKVCSPTQDLVRAGCSLREEEPGAGHDNKASKSSDLASKGQVQQYPRQAGQAQGW